MKDVTEIPKPQSGSNDAQPIFIGSTVYFKSDRDGEFNLYSYDLTSKQIAKHTDFKNFGLLDLDVNANGFLLLEQGGYLHTYNPSFFHALILSFFMVPFFCRFVSACS